MRTRQRSLRRTTLGRAVRGANVSTASFSYVIADNPEFLNIEHWDGLTEGESFFLSRSYQRLLREEGSRSLSSRYGLIYQDDKAVAALVAHVVTEHGGRERSVDAHPDLSSPPSDGGMNQRTTGSSTLPPRYLLCGDVYAGGWHGVALREEVKLGKLWPAITELLERIKRQEAFRPDHDHIIIKDIPAVIASDTRALRSRHFHRLNASSPMILTMPERWVTFDDYVNHLNVRHRTGAYRVSRDLQRAGLVQDRVDVRAQSARMYSLYRAVQRIGNASLAPLSPGFLSALTQAVPVVDIRCSGFFDGDNLMGYVLSLRDRDTSVCFCLGWDREGCGKLPMLPALLYAAIGDALSMGCNRIDYGRTALKAKAQVGAHPEATEVWVKHAGSQLPLLLNQVMEPLAHSPIPDPVLTFSL